MRSPAIGHCDMQVLQKSVKHGVEVRKTRNSQGLGYESGSKPFLINNFSIHTFAASLEGDEA